MTPLTLQRLAEIEAAAAEAIQWRTLTANGHYFGNVCDPATIAALCKIARAAVESSNGGFRDRMSLYSALRDAGLLE